MSDAVGLDQPAPGVPSGGFVLSGKGILLEGLMSEPESPQAPKASGVVDSAEPARRRWGAPEP